MQTELWWVWMVVAAILVVGEILTAGFFILWFGIGAAVAGILTLAGVGTAGQLTAFILVSGGLFLGSRKFAEKWTKPQPPGIGADRLLGKSGVVLEDIDNHNAAGSVRIEREEWRAESETGDVIPAGKRVDVLRINGTRLVVRTAKEE